MSPEPLRPSDALTSGADTKVRTLRGPAFVLLALTLGLLGWRALAVFTIPALTPPASGLTAMVETITGPNRVRIAEGTDGARIILIDGLDGSLSKADITKLRELTSALYPDAPPAIIRQFPFAGGHLLRPDKILLAELAILGLLAGFTLWFVMYLAPGTPRATGPLREPETHRLPALRASPAKAQPAIRPLTPRHELSPVEKATQLAQTDPETTAAIIRKWLQQEGSRA